jgi:DNA (cytosine-5)-methyltransferase 1
MIKLLDTFAWVWWFHLALKQSIWNIECIWFSEVDKFAKQVYLQHFPWTKDLWDITKINIDWLEDFDLLTWWFPCQDVSVAGKQSLEWWRTILVEYLLQILEKKKPKYFVFENVKWFMSKKFDTFRESIFRRIKDAWYNFKCEIINTKNFWLPQNRERVFIVWYLEWDYIFPEWQNLKIFLKDILQQQIDWEWENKILMTKKTQKVKIRKHKVNIEWLKDVLRSNRKNVKDISEYLNINKTKVEHWFRKDNCFSIPDQKIWFKLKEFLWIKTNEFDQSIIEFEIRDWKFDMSRRIYHINWISPTILWWNKKNILTDWKKYFSLQTKDVEKLQWFPIWWSSDYVSSNQAYKQMGNAVSIPVVKSIFDNLFLNLK